MCICMDIYIYPIYVFVCKNNKEKEVVNLRGDMRGF